MDYADSAATLAFAVDADDLTDATVLEALTAIVRGELPF